jgi:hypothetical protein
MDYEKIKVIDADIEKRVMTGFMSRDTSFTLYVNGPFTPAGIGRLVEQLQMVQSWLVADEKALKELKELSPGEVKLMTELEKIGESAA